MVAVNGWENKEVFWNIYFQDKEITVRVKESVTQKKNGYIIMGIYIELIMNLFTFLF